MINEVKKLPFEFNKTYNFVKDGEKYIYFTEKETEILDKLLHSNNYLCSYDKLNSTNSKNRTTTRVYIHRINEKLKDYLKIVSITNSGYLLMFNEE